MYPFCYISLFEYFLIFRYKKIFWVYLLFSLPQPWNPTFLQWALVPVSADYNLETKICVVVVLIALGWRSHCSKVISELGNICMYVYKYLYLCLYLLKSLSSNHNIHECFLPSHICAAFLTVRKLATIILNIFTYLIYPPGCFQSPITASSLSPTWIPSLSCLCFDTPHQAGGVARFSK